MRYENCDFLHIIYYIYMLETVQDNETCIFLFRLFIQFQYTSGDEIHLFLAVIGYPA